MRTFKQGDIVDHPDYGHGTVTFVGDERIGIEFGTGQHALLRTVDLCTALSATGPDPAQSAGTTLVTTSLAWQDNTFVIDANADRHSMGSHWKPFADNARVILEQLPHWLPKMDVFRAYGDFIKPQRAIPGTWVQGFSLCWPDARAGLVATCRSGRETNDLVTLYPYYEHGIETRLTLARVSVWESGLEAHIHAQWGEAEIDFFDAAYVANRGWYETDKDYDFILLGIAYKAKRSSVFAMPFTPNPDQVAWEASLAEARGEQPPDVPTKIDLSGMAMMLPVPDWDLDDYSFRGPVKTVEEVTDMLGESGWRVVVTVFRFGDIDADLAILITRRTWQSELPPAPGEDVEGTLWLQGRLWQPVHKDA